MAVSSGRQIREIVLSVSTSNATTEVDEDTTRGDDADVGYDFEEDQRFVIEVLCIELINGARSGRRFHSYVKPIPDPSKLHLPAYGIGEGTLANSPSFDKISKDIKNFISDSPIIVYAKSYEKNSINDAYSEINEDGLPDYQFIEVFEILMDMFPDSRNGGMGEMAAHLGVQLQGDIDESSEDFAESLINIYTEIRSRNPQLTIPPVPVQGPGPHFEINNFGKIDLVLPSSLDEQGNNLKSLQSLHPLLQELANGVSSDLSGGNSPHAKLLSRVAEYQAYISKDIKEINFAVLYGVGIRLENAAKSARIEIEKSELPRFNEATDESLQSLLQLHGAFILSTSDGRELIAAEERYARTAEDELDLQTATLELGDKLRRRADLIDPFVAQVIASSSEESINHRDSLRSATFSASTATNISIVVAAAAIVGAFPLIGGAVFGLPGSLSGGILALIGAEGLKKSKPFTATTKTITDKIDAIPQVEIEKILKDKSSQLKPFFHFAMQNEELLRRLAGNRARFSWLHEILDWVRDNNSKSD